jgi:AcrR family transcriptional regulator
VPSKTKSEQSSIYRSPLRARQAAETRRTVVKAASHLFYDRGWAGTTLSAIASEAGTAVETVYSGFGSKLGVLLAAIDAAIAGDEEDVAVADRPEFAALAEGTLEDRLERAAEIITASLLRAIPLMSTLQQAAASEEKAKARLDRYESDRRTTIEAGLALILGGVAPEEVVDTLWALAGPEVFVKLTRDRGWTPDRYERWLVQAGIVLLAGGQDQ